VKTVYFIRRGEDKMTAKKTKASLSNKRKPASAKKRVKKVAARSAAYSGLEKLQKAAGKLLGQVQKRVADALGGDEVGDKEKPATNAELRKQWIKKRVARTKLGKALTKKKP
jgi:hypothetical protein